MPILKYVRCFTWSILTVSILILNTGCYLNANVSTLNSANNSVVELPRIQVLGFKTLGSDSIADEYITDSAAPILDLTSVDPDVEISFFEIYSASNLNLKLCNAETTDVSEKSIYFSNCSLPVGKYLLKTISKLKNGESKITEFSFEKNIMSLNQGPVLNLLSGEQVNLTPTGGVPKITGADQGSGFLDISTLLYKISFSSDSGSEQVTLSDSKNQSLTYTANWRSFKDLATISSTSTQSVYNNLYSIIEYNNIYYAISNVSPESSLPTPYSNFSGTQILKSTDSGVTWTNLSSIQGVQGKNLTASVKILNKNGVFYVLGYSTNGSGDSGYLAFISQSLDLGISWKTIITYQNSELYNLPKDAIITADNNLIFVGNSYTISTSTTSTRYTVKCSLSDFTCQEIEKVQSPDTVDEGTYRIAMDGSNNLYTLSRHFISLAQNCRSILKKSTDNGSTWSQIADNICNSNYEAFAVSNSGKNIVIGGGSTIAELKYSTDFGVNWTSLGLASTFSVQDLVVNDSDELIINGYRWAALTYYWRRYTTTLGNLPTLYSDVVLANYPRFFSFTDSSNRIVLSDGFGLLKYTSTFGTSWVDLTFPSFTTRTKSAIFTDSITASSGTLFACGISGASSSTYTGNIYSSANGILWTPVATTVAASYLELKTIYESASANVITGGSNGNNAYIFNSLGTALLNTLPPGSTKAKVNKITGSNLNIYAIGEQYSAGKYLGMIYRSTSGGTVPWNPFVIDSQEVNGYSTKFTNGFYDGTTLYVTGFYVDSSSVQHWYVKKFSGSGNSIEDDDTINPSAVEPVANAILVNPDNSIFVAGTYKESGITNGL